MTSTVLLSLAVTLVLGGLVVLAALLGTLALCRVVGRGRRRRLERARTRYRLLLSADATLDDRRAMVASLARRSGRERRELGDLLLAPLTDVRGAEVDMARTLAGDLGLLRDWHRDLAAGGWRRRAHAARCLGLVGSADDREALERLLDDASDEVRAAAVDALGYLGDARAIPSLLKGLDEKAPLQTIRVVAALRTFGVSTARALRDLADRRPDRAEAVARLLGGLALGSEATRELAPLLSHPSPAIRRAALQALGRCGLDEASFYQALKLAGDDDAETRHHAVVAIANFPLVEAHAASHLVARLADRWPTAVRAALALASLGEPGRTELARRRGVDGQAGALARLLLADTVTGGHGQ
jgi:HEAT repeat protein